MRTLLVIVSLLAAGIAQAATFAKPELTLELPEGWVEVPASVLQQFHADLQRRAPLAQVPKYDYAFQSTNGPPWLHYPYVLVKVTSTGRPTEHDLETLPTFDLDSKVRDKRDAWSGLLEDSSLGQMRYDKSANVVWLSSKSTVASVGAVTGLSGFIPTEQGFVELHAYAPEAGFAQELPVFQRVILGAKIAPSLAYTPRWTDALARGTAFDFRRLGIALGIGAAIAILFAVFRRRKN